MHPTTLPEWQTYIDSLTGADLLSKAKAANSLTFVRGLEAEGMAPQNAIAILRMFAVRLVADGQILPTRYAGALLDFNSLVDSQPTFGESSTGRVARQWLQSLYR
jgi:hypothetical protein